MEEDPYLEGFVELWDCDGITCVTRNDVMPVMSAHVRLPDNLVGAWTSYTEASRALALVSCRTPFVLRAGPPDDARWLGLNVFGESPEAPTSAEDVKQELFERAEIVAARLLAASQWAAEGNSVKPVDPTHDHRQVRELMARVGEQLWRGEVMLRPGESAWNPGCGYRPFVGRQDGTTMIRYEITFDGITATQID